MTILKKVLSKIMMRYAVDTKNKKQKTSKFFLLLTMTFLCLLVSSVKSETLAHASQSHEIIVAINTAVINKIATLKTDPCLQPDDFHLYSDKKHLLSLNIFCRALTAANYKFHLKMFPSPNTKRGKWIINDGKAHVFLHLLQKKTTNDTSVDGIVYSDVVRINDSRLSAFFTSVDNHAALAANSFADIQKLKAAVPLEWLWQQSWLDRLEISYHSLLYKNLFKFIESQRADIVLLDMNGKSPTERTLLGVNLKATGQVYFVGNKAERFALSKNIKGADKLMSALLVGLKKLKASGVIDEVFSGLIIDESQLDGWQKISHPPRNNQ